MRNEANLMSTQRLTFLLGEPEFSGWLCSACTPRCDGRVYVTRTRAVSRSFQDLYVILCRASWPEILRPPSKYIRGVEAGTVKSSHLYHQNPCQKQSSA